VSEKLERALGRPIVIENVSGAGGAIGAQRAIAAPPDGYTLYMGANSELLVNKAFQPQLPYDAVRDLKPIGLVATSPILLIGSNELPPKTWPELLAFASSRSQKLTYGTAGIGSIVHLGGEMLTLKAKLTLTQVPYRGSVPMMNDLIAGHIDIGISSLASAGSFLDAGKAHPYLVLSERRTEFAPNVPAVSEMPGLSDLILELWYGLFAPSNVPASVISVIEKNLLAVLDDPDVKRKLAVQALSVRKMSSTEFGEFVSLEANKYRRMVSETKIKAE
jgi:tripartite-type tricarboxylate transporter receptor subunit TctC